MTQGERIRKVRKSLNLTLEKFGERIGMKKNSMSQLENGVNSVSDQVVILICREFNVREQWLRTGEGDMYIEMEHKELNYDMAIKILTSLDADDWSFLIHTVQVLYDKKKGE